MESWDQNHRVRAKSAWLILWRKQKAELEKITSIRNEHWPSWDILEPGGGRLQGTDIYKPLVIDQVIVLRRDYKGSVGAGVGVSLWTGDNANNGHTIGTLVTKGPTLETWSLGL